MRTMKLGFVAAALLVAMAGKVPAGFQAFNFSINDTIGNTSGTVSGEIVLPFSGDGSGVPFEVQIDQQHSDFFPALGFPVPLNVTEWPLQANNNDFTVTDGKLTFASFYAAYESNSLNYEMAILSDSPSYLVDFGNNLQLVGPASFSAHATPEPASIMLWCAGILTAGVFQFVRRRQGKAARSIPAC
jgi:hypothetical protein